MRSDQLDYVLPPELIATRPAEPRDAARLLVARRETGEVQHHRVRDLPGLGILHEHDLLVVNQTRVLPAAFRGVRVATGGRVKGLYLRSDEAGRWQVMLETRGKLGEGERIALDERASLVLEESLGRGKWLARGEAGEPAERVLMRLGEAPLPPYIRKARRHEHRPEVEASDRERYNTVFAREAGSVAAPTAGLHFTPELLATLERQGVRRASVTLHVGTGTFMPVRTENLEEHRMHAEWLHVPGETVEAIQRTREAGGRIMPVGTTSVRALESLPEPLEIAAGGFTTETRLFIRPNSGFEFRFTDMLLTNFHLPRSTLLALVSALPGVGLDRLKRWYGEAIEQGYRFYSYGDTMLVC
ncbi:MAG: tRNA preQ1(34) S-adenosylmethionine ribosyltransferase-isomerase QueA [Phycisphaeraceae bacterium]